MRRLSSYLSAGYRVQHVCAESRKTLTPSCEGLVDSNSLRDCFSLVVLVSRDLSMLIFSVSAHTTRDLVSGVLSVRLAWSGSTFIAVVT